MTLYPTNYNVAQATFCPAGLDMVLETQILPTMRDILKSGNTGALPSPLCGAALSS